MRIRDRLHSSDKSRRKVRRKYDEIKGLSITSLLDVLTIILVFLMKNVNMESTKLSAVQGIQYPSTITNDALLAKTGTTPIKVFTDKVLVGIESLSFGSPADLLQNAQKRSDISKYLELEAADIVKAGQETCLVVQADRYIPCDYITEIVRIATASGYTYIYFATLEDADWLKNYNVSSAQ